MVMTFLDQAAYMLENRGQFTNPSASQRKTLATENPILHEIVAWFAAHPACEAEAMFDEAYRLATSYETPLRTGKLDWH